MNKKRLFLFGCFMIVFFGLSLWADVGLDIKLRFFEGQKEEVAAPTPVVTSSYLKPTVSASIRSEFDLAKQQNQIKKVFNLKDVKLLTEADLRWRTAETESNKISHIFRLDSKEYLVLITPMRKEWEHRFRIEVLEQSSEGKRSLLDTEIILPEKNIAVFGFEDTQGKPYFLSFHVTGAIVGGVVGGVLGGVEGGVEGEVKGGIEGALAGQEMEEFAKGAVRVEKDIKPPRLLKMVEPSYPEDAKKARIGGVVILAARVNEKGDVEEVKVLRSIPLLDQAAIDAVRQWKYEPLIIEGKLKSAVFTVTVNFKLKDEEKKKEIEEFEKGAVKAEGDIKPPHLIKKVDPIYPEEARKKKVEGIVILSARTNEKGDVERVMLLKSIPLLDQAAIDALKQWKYEPIIIDGKPRSIIFTVTVRFQLK